MPRRKKIDRRPWERNLRLLAWIRASYSMLFIIPVITLYWQRYGMNVFDILWLQAIFALFVVLLEVPTGYVADRLGRKKAILIGLGTAVAGWALYAAADSFAWFLVVECVLAAGFSMLSGTDSALLYESLKELGDEDSFTRVGGRQEAALHWAEGGAAMAGGFLAIVFPAEVIMLLTAGAALGGFCLALFLTEPHRERYSHPRGTLYGLYKIARFTFLRSQMVRHVVFLMAACGLATMAGVWLYQPLWQERGVPVWMFGLLWAALSVPGALAGHFAHRLEAFFGERAILWLLPLPVVLGYGMLAVLPGVAGLAFMYFVPLLRGMNYPLLAKHIHAETRSDKRATVLSMQSWLFRIVFFGLGPLVGWIAQSWSIAWAFAFCAAWTLVSVWLFVPAVARRIGGPTAAP